MVFASALDTWETVIGVTAMVLGYVAVAALWWFMIGAPRRRGRCGARDAAERSDTAGDRHHGV